VEAPVGLGVLEEPVAVSVHLSRVSQVFFPALLEVILINEVLSRVVRGIDIDALDFVEVGFLQYLEGLQVVPFNIQVAGILPVHTLFLDRPQGFVGGQVSKEHGFLFAGPGELL